MAFSVLSLPSPVSSFETLTLHSIERVVDFVDFDYLLTCVFEDELGNRHLRGRHVDFGGEFLRLGEEDVRGSGGDL